MLPMDEAAPGESSSVPANPGYYGTVASWSCFLLLALVLAWQFQRTLREQRRIDHTDRITALLNELERLVVDQETGLRDYQLTHDASTLEPYQSAEGALHGTLDRLLYLVRDDPDQLMRLRQIRDSHEAMDGFCR